VEIRKFLTDAAEQCTRGGDAALVVTTNNQQRMVNEVLKGMGFQHTPWMNKLMHPETQVRLWWLPLHD
jgi:hypothetical protein